MANLLQAIIGIRHHNSCDISPYFNMGNIGNRAIQTGDALEFFVKDAFSNSLSLPIVQNRAIPYNTAFSWTGSSTHPPDIMLRAGDAIEVKKQEKRLSDLALNSSYPKDYLYNDSPMLTNSCRNCEAWERKDMIYAIGICMGSVVKMLWFVYGDCFIAERQTYERMKSEVQSGIESIPEINFSPTNELGRINRVDILGYTYLRVRGMWGVKNPISIFPETNNENNFNIVKAVMLKSR